MLMPTSGRMASQVARTGLRSPRWSRRTIAAPSRSSATSWTATTRWPQANRRWLADRRHRRAQHDELAGAGQDHAAANAPSRELGRAAGGGDRGRPGDPPRRRAHPVHRCAGRCRSTPAPAATSTPTMLRRALEALSPAADSLVFVENVGNLVCPALFDLGETAQGRGHLGHRRRRQATEVPPHVLRGRPARGQQDRPAALRRLRRGAMHRQRARRQPGAGGAADVRHRTGEGCGAWTEWVTAQRIAVPRSTAR